MIVFLLDSSSLYSFSLVIRLLPAKEAAKATGIINAMRDLRLFLVIIVAFGIGFAASLAHIQHVGRFQAILASIRHVTTTATAFHRFNNLHHDVG